MTTVAFFNNKGGVGKTSLVYHLAWMYADLGVTVVAADLDPQANLTSMFLDEWEMDDLWSSPPPRETVHGALLPLLEGTSDISTPVALMPRPALCLVPGDLSLSVAEDEFSGQWPLCLDGNVRAFRVISALGRILQRARDEAEAELVLVDVGPNLGAMNRGGAHRRGFCRRPAGTRLVFAPRSPQPGPHTGDLEAWLGAALGPSGHDRRTRHRQASRRTDEANRLRGTAARSSLGSAGQGICALDGCHSERVPNSGPAEIRRPKQASRGRQALPRAAQELQEPHAVRPGRPKADVPS